MAAAGLIAVAVQLSAQDRVRSISVGGTPRISAADAARPGAAAARRHGGPDRTLARRRQQRRHRARRRAEARASCRCCRGRRRSGTSGTKDEPYIACLPMSVPRINPYPWKFAMSYTSKGLTHIYVLHETGDAGAHRVVYMDGRKHPVDRIRPGGATRRGGSKRTRSSSTRSATTTSSGSIARGTPHTEKLHTIERWTRMNFGTMTNDFTLDDPGAFSRPVQLKFTANAHPPGPRPDGVHLPRGQRIWVGRRDYSRQ